MFVMLYNNTQDFKKFIELALYRLSYCVHVFYSDIGDRGSENGPSTKLLPGRSINLYV